MSTPLDFRISRSVVIYIATFNFHNNLTMASLLSLSLLLLLPIFVEIPLSSQSRVAEHETHLHLYFHERNSGPNSTTAVVVPRDAAAFGFGTMAVLDDELREGAEPDSKLVGRAQAFLPRVSQEEIAFIFAANFLFMEGEYKGSSLAVFGPAVLASDMREWSIVGGTGSFRNARGYVLGKKLSFCGGTLLLELDIYASH